MVNGIVIKRAKDAHEVESGANFLNLPQFGGVVVDFFGVFERSYSRETTVEVGEAYLDERNGVALVLLHIEDGAGKWSEVVGHGGGWHIFEFHAYKSREIREIFVDWRRYIKRYYKNQNKERSIKDEQKNL